MTTATTNESAKPPPKRLPSTRSLFALVTAITGLVTAIAAFRRTPDEPTAKESYVVLQKAFLEQQSEVDGLKKDVLSVRASLEAYVRAKEGEANVVPAPVPSSSSTPPDTLPPVAVHVRPTPSSSPHAPPSSSARVVVIPSARAAVPRPTPLPDVRELESQAKARKD